MEHEVNEYCKEKFKTFEDRLEKGDTKFEVQGETIIEVKTDVKHLTNSLDGLSKAIWAMSGSIFLALLGFFFWYVQNN